MESKRGKANQPEQPAKVQISEMHQKIVQCTKVLLEMDHQLAKLNKQLKNLGLNIKGK